MKGRAALEAYYQQAEVAADYTQERFGSFPWTRVEEQEREAVGKTIEAVFPLRRDLALLDVASGEGRVLRTLAPYGEVTALDSSHAMLRLARQRHPGPLRVVQGNVFDAALDERFDVITCFRLLRHFEYPDRRALYEKLRGWLKDGGIAIVDAPNPLYEVLNRTRYGWGEAHIYDVFWTRQ